MRSRTPPSPGVNRGRRKYRVDGHGLAKGMLWVGPANSKASAMKKAVDAFYMVESSRTENPRLGWAAWKVEGEPHPTLEYLQVFIVHNQRSQVEYEFWVTYAGAIRYQSSASIEQLAEYVEVK